MDLHVEEGYLLGGVFKSGFDHGVEVVHEIFHELDLFGGFKEDHGDVIMNLFQKGIALMKASRKVSASRHTKRLAYGGTALVPMAVPTSWRKCLSMNERLLFFMFF